MPSQAMLSSLVDSLALKTVYLNGWSLGGAVATRAAHSLGSALCGVNTHRGCQSYLYPKTRPAFRGEC